MDMTINSHVFSKIELQVENMLSWYNHEDLCSTTAMVDVKPLKFKAQMVRTAYSMENERYTKKK
jgi:hypothetical protein